MSNRLRTRTVPTKRLSLAEAFAVKWAGKGESALSLDFTDDHFQGVAGRYGSAFVKDNTTLANNFVGTPYDLLTYTSPSLKMTMGPNGLLRFGAHNLWLQSETPSDSAWGVSNCTKTASQTDAEGRLTAVLNTVSSNTSNVFFNFTSGDTAATGRTYSGSIDLKAGTGTWVCVSIWGGSGTGLRDAGTYVNLSTGALGSTVTSAGYTYVSSSIVDKGNGWYRVTVSGTSVGEANVYLAVRLVDGDGAFSYTAVSGKTYYAAKPHLRRTPSDSTYLATTTAARYSLPYEWSSAGVLQGILVEEARTNLCTYSDDLTNAAWTKTNMTTAKTATGPDGVANSATTITASAGNATVLQSITSASAARITSCYIKRRTGTGNIDMTQDNGTTWATVTVTSSWTRVNIASATVTNPIVGLRVVTNTDAVDVALFQHEVGAFVTSPIPTIAATATRAIDNISLATSAFPYLTTAATIFFEWTPKAIGNYLSALAAADFNNAVLIYGDINFRVTPSPNWTADVGNLSVNTVQRVAGSIQANDGASTLNGVAPTTTTSLTMPSAATSLWIGNNYTATSASNSYIRKVSYIPRRVSNAQLQSMTA